MRVLEPVRGGCSELAAANECVFVFDILKRSRMIIWCGFEEAVLSHGYASLVEMVR